MYILRSKAEAKDVSADYIIIGLAGAQAAAAARPLFDQIPSTPLTLTTARDASLLRLDTQRFQIIAPLAGAHEFDDAIGKSAALADPDFWDWLDIRAGIPFIMPATQEQFVPQMANLDLIGGVSFTKGCYPGQEIVARMHYLGRLKQRMYLANLPAAAAPKPGDKLYSSSLGDQAAGMIVNAAPAPAGGHDVLAVMQIASAERADVRWRSLDGPRLELMELPYRV